MKKLFLLSTLLVSATILSSCNKVTYLPKEEMLKSFKTLTEESKNDYKQEKYFKNIEYISEQTKNEGKEVKLTKEIIKIDYVNKIYSSKNTIINKTNNTQTEYNIYSFVDDKDFYFLKHIKTDKDRKTYFKCNKDLNVITKDLNFNPYNIFINALNFNCDKEMHVRNITNLNNSLNKIPNYIEEYDIKGYFKNEFTFRLDYNKYTIDDETKEYNLPIEHYVEFKNNFVNECYFKYYNKDYMKQNYIVNSTNFKIDEINLNEYTESSIIQPKFSNINMMIGY